MKAEVKQEDGAWSLYVNGHRMIERESFAIVDRVRDELEHPSYDNSEASEVAQAILRAASTVSH